MRRQELHPAQASIMEALRHATNASFSELMRPTGMTSDNFKFHLRSLQKAGYIFKCTPGRYELTISGKEFANSLTESARYIQRQPKISLLVVLSRYTPTGKLEFLLQQRHRKPFYGFWGFVGGKACWGDDFELTAAMELQKQTGLQADLRVGSFFRKTDLLQNSTDILEDKLFVVLLASNLVGELTTDWRGGTNQWLTPGQLAIKKHRFTDALEIIQTLHSGSTLPPYTTYRLSYPAEEY